MSITRWLLSVSLLTLLWVSAAVAAADGRVQPSGDSDARAIEIAEATVDAMGGWDALNATRFVSWDFFGMRQHHWDRETGDVRIESEREGVTTLILMNIHSKLGSVYKDGQPLSGEELAAALGRGHEAWVNDSYWMFMPYKMLDPGVTLKYAGEKETAAGNVAWVVDMTFESVGYTPQNRYHVYVGHESGLVEQWDFYSEASNPEPNFASPWDGWERFGGIMLATSHGRDRDWKITVHDELPRSVFTDLATAAKDE
jgi:hypothetical protein